jgi:nitroimidazol reductase NimA-like FMN-containing flavoprotein (pyridoxamine 5'-phosphate oxidase superfamily)
MRELTDEEIDEVLMRNGIGTLALNDDGVPYPIPMSFGYDGEKPIFVMQFGAAGRSRKVSCLDASPTAGFLVYEQVGTGLDAEWHSVIMSGDVREIETANATEAFSALASNAEFAPDLTVWGAPFDDVELQLYELVLEECWGRTFPPQVE